MNDPDILLALFEAAMGRFKAGRMSIHSLVTRLEEVGMEATRRGLDGSDDLMDAWERLETYNALALEGDRRGLWARYWIWRTRRELRQFEGVARRVLGTSRGRAL